MEKGMARREGRFLKIDAHPMNGGSEEMISMSTLLEDSVECLSQLDHPDSCLDLCDRRLLGF